MYRIARLAAIASLLSLTLFAVGCGSKSDDAGSTTTPAPTAKSDASATPGAAGKAEGAAMSGQAEVLPPPPNAVKK